MFYNNKFVLKNKSNFPLFTLYLRINEYIFIQYIRPCGGVKAFSFSLIIIEHSLHYCTNFYFMFDIKFTNYKFAHDNRPLQ